MRIEYNCKLMVTVLLGILLSGSLGAQKIITDIHPETGAIIRMSVEGDPHRMNWILQTDGSQYKWITSQYGWGLGRVQIDNTVYSWSKAASIYNGKTVYHIGNQVDLIVTRQNDGDDLIEEYQFQNITDSPVTLSHIEIYTPFNDNYPDAATCMTQRAHAHIWAGGHAAYINAIRMGAEAPHLGLMMTEGAIPGYSIRERSSKKGSSNFRGVIGLNPESVTLKSKKHYKIAWRLFSHKGYDDFNTQLLEKGGTLASCEKYVYEVGETAVVTLRDKKRKKQIRVPVMRTGEMRIDCPMGRGRSTYVVIDAISSVEHLIDARANFILDKQQYKDKTNPRYGAFLPYDTENKELYLDYMHENRRDDLNEGAERLGMGIFLALRYQQIKDPKIKEALIEYANFIRTQLQKPDYETWSKIEKKGRRRAYNYPWVANFFFEMFNVTGEREYLYHGYRTMRAMDRIFGHKFYAIETPAIKSIRLLSENGFRSEADTLMEDYRKLAESYIQYGTNYPKSEVNYEQSIVAPSVTFVAQMYLLTKEPRYLEFVRKTMPILEAFTGFQPSCHLNEIAVRHWDGYWFGKYKIWGDTFPHYWSTLNAVAYAYYSHCTGDDSYMDKAKNILTNNLCQFFEDGSASCAYIYPDYVDDLKTGFYEPMANDQDWALVFYLEWMR